MRKYVCIDDSTSGPPWQGEHGVFGGCARPAGGLSFVRKPGFSEAETERRSCDQTRIILKNPVLGHSAADGISLFGFFRIGPAAPTARTGLAAGGAARPAPAAGAAERPESEQHHRAHQEQQQDIPDVHGRTSPYSSQMCFVSDRKRVSRSADRDQVRAGLAAFRSPWTFGHIPFLDLYCLSESHISRTGCRSGRPAGRPPRRRRTARAPRSRTTSGPAPGGSRRPRPRRACTAGRRPAAPRPAAAGDWP